MRVIKFRVWDRQEKRMSSSHLIGSRWVYFGEEKLTPRYAGDYERFIWMQFTGMHDRDGKEIYEGDIIDGHSDGLTRVVWRNGAWELDFADGGNIAIQQVCSWGRNDATVVGNVYEDIWAEEIENNG